MNIILVGCGLFNIVVANLLSNAFNITIIDKRNHIGGNCYDFIDYDTGIIIHKYGPHIFHIGDKFVYNYISKFTEFNNYKHQVRAEYNNIKYEFPINLDTINSFFSVNLRPYEVDNFLREKVKKHYISKPSNMEEKIINLIGVELYEAFFKEYTIKQWGKFPSELPEDTIKRIPIKNNYDTNYYKKTFNGIPKDGYSTMFSRMLAHKNISVELEVDFFEYRDYFLNKGIVIFTGSIDEFFDYKFGKLEYRSLRFQEELHHVNDWQGNSVINYPELKFEYTRICEHKHFYPEKWDRFSSNKTIIYKEIPYSSINSEPYYPITDEQNLYIYNKYLQESLQIDNLYFGGRLGEYKYYDMEDTIKSAHKLANKLLELYS